MSEYNFNPTNIKWTAATEQVRYESGFSRILAPRSQPLSDRYPGMWQGMTTGQPSSRFYLPAESLRRTIITIAEQAVSGSDQALVLLNDMYREKLTHAKFSILAMLGLKADQNNELMYVNSGAEALGIAGLLLSPNDPRPVLSTKRSGRLVNLALTGTDPYTGTGNIMFAQSVGLFSGAFLGTEEKQTGLALRDVYYYPSDAGEATNLSDQYAEDINGAERQLSDETILHRFADSVENNDFSVCHIPTVDSLGRMLPWKEMVNIVNKKNARVEKYGGKPTKIILNLVQAVGRGLSEDLNLEGVEFDAAVFVGHKGLGAPMSTGFIVFKEEAVNFDPGFNYPRYFQLAVTKQYATTSARVSRNIETQFGQGSFAVSLPELEGAIRSIDDFMMRGTGQNYQERRQFNYSLMVGLTENLETSLQRIRGVKTLRSLNPEVKFMPGIVSFIVEGFDVRSVAKVKEAMQEKYGIVLSGNVGNVMRMTLPEHFFYNAFRIEPYTVQMEKNLALSVARLRNELGLKRAKEMIKEGVEMFFDVDGILVDAGNFYNNSLDTDNRPLSNKLRRLARKARIGILTDRSLAAVKKHLLKLDEALFPGIWVGEGGHVLSLDKGKTMEILTSETALKEMRLLEARFERRQDDLTGSYFYQVPGLDLPIHIADGIHKGLGSIVIWHPTNSDERKRSREVQYKKAAKQINQLIKSLKLTSIKAISSGNGSVRVVEKGRTKQTALIILARRKLISLKKTAFFCNGQNDVAAARLIIKHSGVIVAPNDADDELSQLADYVSEFSGTRGTTEAIKALLSKK